VRHGERKFASKGDIYILIYYVYHNVVDQIVSRLDNDNDNDDDDVSSSSFIFDKHHTTCVHVEFMSIVSSSSLLLLS